MKKLSIYRRGIASLLRGLCGKSLMTLFFDINGGDTKWVVTLRKVRKVKTAKSVLTHVLGKGTLTEMHFLTKTPLFFDKNTTEDSQQTHHRGLSAKPTTEDSAEPTTGES